VDLIEIIIDLVVEAMEEDSATVEVNDPLILECL
jgi:hypothetical protein